MIREKWGKVGEKIKGRRRVRPNHDAMGKREKGGVGGIVANNNEQAP